MNIKKFIKIILSLTILLGLILYAGNIYSADSNDEILLKGIFEAYMSQGESGLREYVKKHKGLIHGDIIKGIAGFGLHERKETLM